MKPELMLFKCLVNNYHLFRFQVSLLRERLGIDLPIKPQKINHTSKAVIRIMSRCAFDAHTDPLFKNLNILNFESIDKLQIG